MSASLGPARYGPATPDDAMRRYVDAVRRELQPDPLFRRRLRGAVMNQFVAQREGATSSPSLRGAQMGRLGRACLYAALATVVSVGGVMAASESAIPGDLLYPLKRSIEEMRMSAAPAELRDDLAVYALAERVDELERLIESRAFGAVADAAADIRASYEQLLAAGGRAAAIDDRLESQFARLEAVLDHAPVHARRAVERAMGGALGLESSAFDAVGPSEGSGEHDSPAGTGGGAGEGGSQGGQSGSAGHEASGQVDRTPSKDESPKPEHTPRPERSPKPIPSASPELP